MTAYTILKALSLTLAAVTSVCYLYQILYLFIPRLKKLPAHKPEKPNRYAILIAARNEEAVLPHLLESIRAQDYPSDLLEVYVVADNCTDRTAELAAAQGAHVFSRFNTRQIGKGYALDFLLEQIRASGRLDSFDAFLIFDADNLLQPDYVTQINRVCSDGYEAFCGYRNIKNFGSNWISSGSGLWYLHESTHMNRSRMCIESCCAVNGTGFGFTRALLERLGGWKFFTLTEDVEFNAWCATHGVRIGYCHDAMVYDEQPLTFRQSWRQRTRWTQGGLQVSLRYAGDLLRGLFKGGRTGYASFEFATLSLWGYGMAALCFGLTMLVTFLAQRWMGLVQAGALALVNTYLTMFAIGAWTMATEWKRIRASTGQKLAALFTFPIFMMTYIPIAFTALFRKFSWQPIDHTVAISTVQLQER